MPIGNDTPFQADGTIFPDYRALFYSKPEAALTVPITLMKGYGILPAGLVLAKITAGTNLGKFIPYDPYATITGAEVYTPRAYLVQDGAADVYAYVTLNDAYKFQVGDHLYAFDSDNTNGTQEADMGLITAIDVTTYTHMAKITATSNNSASVDVSKFGYVSLKGAQTAVGILMKSVDTGIGATAQGANAELIIGNCVLYLGACLNADAAAKTAISGTAFGRYLYIR